jgi:hypothetical protein
MRWSANAASDQRRNAMPIPSHEMPIELGLLRSLGDAERLHDDRRYLLVPISGCANEDPAAGHTIHLEPLRLSDFNEDMGWHPRTLGALAYLELGESICSTDGIAQEQVILRVV